MSPLHTSGGLSCSHRCPAWDPTGSLCGDKWTESLLMASQFFNFSAQRIPLTPGLPSLWLLGTGQIFLTSSLLPSNLVLLEAGPMEDRSIISSSGPLLHFQGCEAIILSPCWDMMELSSAQAFKPKLAYRSCSIPMHRAMQTPEGRWDGSHPLCLITSMPENPLPFDFPDAPSKSEKTVTPAPQQVHWYMAVKHQGVGEVGPIIRTLGRYICTSASIPFSRGSGKRK